MKIIKFVLVASAAFFIAGNAQAQNVGAVTNHAFAIGKGAGTQGFTSLLCASTQLVVGQSAADPICRTVTGDVTIDAAGVTAIGASKVTNTMLVGPVSVAKGGTGQTTISAMLDSAFGSTQGNVLYRNSTVWTVLAPGTSGQLLSSGGPAANLSWITASGTGTVTSVACGTGLTGGTITASGTCAVDYATKSEQQTGTSAVKEINPLHQQDHDSAVKVTASIVGASGVINSSYNVASVSRVSTGLYSITFTTAFANTLYGCVGSPTIGNASVVFSSKVAGSISANVVNFSNTLIDPTTVEVMCFGRQ